MPGMNLMGKRVLITNADVFMGPVLCKVFADHGATVIQSTDSLLNPDAPATVVAAAGPIDVLVVNLAVPAPTTAAIDVLDDEWSNTFAALVNPLPRLIRAVLPAMMERRSGKILVMGSASALRGMKRTSTYSAARGAHWPTFRLWGSRWRATMCKSMPLRRTSSTTSRTFHQTFRPTRASKSD